MRAVVGPRCKVPSCRHEKEIRASLLRRQRCPLDGKKRGLKIRGERGPVLARAQLESDSQKSRGSDDKGPQMRSDAYSNENLDRLELIEPDDVVEDIMTPATALAKVRGDNSLQEVRKVLQDKRVEGVPVVDDGDKVVGVISRHDLRPLLARADYKTYLQTTVASKHMSTPPVCVRPHARIGEAAGVMLAYKVHRLPVVDEAGYLLGIVSRTDIFQVSDIFPPNSSPPLPARERRARPATDERERFFFLVCVARPRCSAPPEEEGVHHGVGEASLDKRELPGQHFCGPGRV